MRPFFLRGYRSQDSSDLDEVGFSWRVIGMIVLIGIITALCFLAWIWPLIPQLKG